MNGGRKAPRSKDEDSSGPRITQFKLTVYQTRENLRGQGRHWTQPTEGETRKGRLFDLDSSSRPT